MRGCDLLSIKQLNKGTIEAILARAKGLKSQQPGPILQGNLIASCFFEPSTRTRLSFEAAMLKLGGGVIGFDEPSNSSMQKGESLQDCMKVVGQYCDVIVFRHPQNGSAEMAALATSTPVINAGDGSNEHPTQTLLDLFTIQECQGRLDGLNLVFAGDLLNGRTVHSLALAMRLFGGRLYFVAPSVLAMPKGICEELTAAGIPFSCHESLEEVISKADILYMTRIQKERFNHPETYEKVKDHFVLTPSLLQNAQKHLKILHPLPRVNEIDPSVDATPFAYYFTQAENGLYVRQALLAIILGK